ncbi:MAG: DUF4397 domain-containing protein [Gemmatimonadota bacterium]
MRFSPLAPLLVLLAAATACSKDDGPTQSSLPPLAFVRYINAVPDTLNTTVRFIDQIEFTPQTFVNVPFRGLGGGGYQATEAGSRQFRVFTADFVNFTNAGNTPILVDTTLTFEAGKYYTLLHTGYARAGVTPKQRIVVMVDDIPTPGASIAIRTLNAGPNLGNLDVYYAPTTTTAISGAPAVAALPYLTASPYRTQAPAAFAALIAASGGTTALGAAAAPAGTAGTLTFNPIAGATIAGSAMTAVAFPSSVAGSRAVSFTTPGVVIFTDNRPPTTAP